MKLKNPIKFLTILALLLSVCRLSFAQGVVDGERNTDGSIKKWHRIEVVLDGPNLAEEPDTFRNFRLDVTFISPSNQRFEVPGFFDGDGDPANTSANSGNKWKARFTTGEEGQWRYDVSFVTGTDVAANLSGGSSGTAPDGQSGSFRVGPQDKSGKDFRAKGKLEYVDEHYLQFANGENFIKVGTNSPEVFIADQDIDGTPTDRDVNHSFQENEFRAGDPTWGNNRGRGIIGVVNYLSGLGVNAHYFLTMNIEGDGTASFPFTGRNSPYTYDVSKLAQWEIIFSHFDTMGLMLHFQTTETENRNYFEELEGGRNVTEFAVARRIYYRELAARFGHHLAITWGVGEENNANFGSGQGNSLSQRLEFAQRISDLTPYNEHIVIHNGGAARNAATDLYTPLLGENNYTGTSLQLVFDEEQHDFIKFWSDESARSGKKWVISYDETFPPMSRIDTRDLDQLRAPTLWSTLLAGGHLEWYHGFQDSRGDTNRSRDYSTLEAQYEVLGIAANFMNDNFAADIHKMIPNDDLINGNLNYAMADPGNVYLFFLRNGGNATVDLSDGNGRAFTVQWFNTRTGQTVDRANVNGGSADTNLGNPPSQTGQDWAVIVRRTGGAPVNQEPSVSFDTPANGITLTAPATLSVDVSASDSDGTVAFVELFLDDVLVRQDSNSPFSFNNNNQDQLLSDLPTGSYTLRAVATDNDGATVSAVRTFSVSDEPANQAPSVSFSRPSSGVNLTASASLVVEASANDSDGSVESVDLSINGVDVRTLRTAPYIWNGSNQDVQLSGLAAGSYTLRAVATDDDGTTAVSQRVFTVTNPSVGNTPPAVSFTRPENNTNLEAPATLIVDVAANDADGSVSTVQLLLDGVNVRTERVNPYRWNDRNQDGELANLAEGTYTLKAIATDNNGATTSIDTTFSVGAETPVIPIPDDETIPVVSFTLPAAGANLTAPATIIANVNATVEQGNINNVALFLDGQLLRRERVVPYVWNSRNGGSLDPTLNNLPAGTYELRAVATSSSGETSQATTMIIVTPN